jgi:hypothetical protein
MSCIDPTQTDAGERGQDPPVVVPPWPGVDFHFGDPDPKFHPDPNLVKLAIGHYDEVGKRHRPKREDILPYLLIRAFTPGDRGARPIWPPTAFWESPDILLIDADYTGPFDPNLLVGTPVSGRSYRVFVRLFNLGLVESTGTNIRAWYVEPGFFTGQSGYEPHLIGGGFADLSDRTRPAAQRLVELDLPWTIPLALTGHECLVASASCIADPWSGSFDANQDRHLGQRNVTIAVGGYDLLPLLQQLGSMVPNGATLEVIHAGRDVIRLIQAIAGGSLSAGPGRDQAPVAAPDPASLYHGVPVGEQRHLLTAQVDDDGSAILPSDVLVEAVRGSAVRSAPGSPLEEGGDAGRLLRGLDPAQRDTVALVSGTNDMSALLPAALRKQLDIPDLRAASIADALGGAKRSAHLLRFVTSDAESAVIGGYSIVVSDGAAKS